MLADEPRDWEQLRSDAFGAVNEILDDAYLAARVTDAILTVVDEETVNRLGAEFVAETKLKTMDFRNGGRLEMEPARDAAALWVGAARGLLDGAENYAEIEMTFGIGEDPQKYAFHVQKVGRLTPHQARRRAEDERDEALAEVAELRETLTELPPGRLTRRDRERIARHAAPQAIPAQLKTARAHLNRAKNMVAWWEALQAERQRQVEAGEWPSREGSGDA